MGVTVNLNQVSASDFFGPNYYTKVPFSQIYYDYSPYLSQVAQTFLPTSPFLNSLQQPAIHQALLRGEQDAERGHAARDRVRDAEHRLQPGWLHHPLFRGFPRRVQHEVDRVPDGEVGEPLGNFEFRGLLLRFLSGEDRRRSASFRLRQSRLHWSDSDGPWWRALRQPRRRPSVLGHSAGRCRL